MRCNHKNLIRSPCRSVFGFLSFKQSLPLIIQHLIAFIQRSIELKALICEYVELALKERYSWDPHMRGLEEGTL